jgi:cytidyltransferase-like protein
MAKKVFVSGCFDLLHSGHIAFFQEASAFGDLYVGIGSDKTIFELKGRVPVNNEDERLYMVKAVSCVKDAFISTGSGVMDFLDELKKLQPDILVVNEDGNLPAKKELCAQYNIEYKILRRTPHQGLTARSTTVLRGVSQIPYRIDLAGGWLDQPYVSKYYPGSVLTISIEPSIEFNERSGMASSTRRKAVELWGTKLPVFPEEKLAKILFCYDNPPGTKEISGAQDAIGIVYPGLNKAYFKGEYWPSRIESVHDEQVLCFLEESLYLIPLGPRYSGFDVLGNTNITTQGAKALADAADNCWQAILERDIDGFGTCFRQGFEAQIAMFPHMVNDSIFQLLNSYKHLAKGWKLSGAGGGGYLIFVSDTPIANAIRIIVRRRDNM